MSNSPLLEVRDLEKYFKQDTSIIDTLLRRTEGEIQAVDGVSLTLEANDSQGLIGESGCGKSTLLKTLMGLHKPTGGEIRYEGQALSEFSRADWKDYRSNVQFIFQDPFNSLDPKMTVEEALLEPLKIHGMDERERRIHDVLEQVELNPAEQYLPRLPKQLSGGEKQRVSIGRALILEPDILLADEPVSMLDVSTQAAILKLLSRLTDDLGLSMLYISHDVSTVSYVCDEMHVMYLGRIVESGRTRELVSDPRHPYADALINAIPVPDPRNDRQRTEIQGAPMDPVDLGEGCRFRDRCPERMDICEQTPHMITQDDGRAVACHLYYDHETRAERAGEGEARADS